MGNCVKIRKVKAALEKQIPKHVLFTPAYQSYFSAGDYAESYCPSCGEYVSEECNYCPFCGQKLLWD